MINSVYGRPDFNKIYIARFYDLVLPAYENQLLPKDLKKFYCFSSNIILNSFPDYLKFNLISLRMLEQTYGKNLIERFEL